jgi:hypothetical protein
MLRTLAVLAALILAAEIADRYQGPGREAAQCLVSFCAGAFVAVRIERQRWREIFLSEERAARYAREAFNNPEDG